MIASASAALTAGVFAVVAKYARMLVRSGRRWGNVKISAIRAEVLGGPVHATTARPSTGLVCSVTTWAIGRKQL